MATFGGRNVHPSLFKYIIIQFIISRSGTLAVVYRVQLGSADLTND
jgi:hypothetical protein